VKITYFNKREVEKQVRAVVLGPLNHPSLIDEGKETRVLVTARERRGRAKILFNTC